LVSYWSGRITKRSGIVMPKTYNTLNTLNARTPPDQPGKALVDCATLEVKDMQEFDAAVKAKGGRFLEAPVSGSKVPAEQVSRNLDERTSICPHACMCICIHHHREGPSRLVSFRCSGAASYTPPPYFIPPPPQPPSSPKGQLIFLAAGDEALYKEVGPQFEAMGKAAFYLGTTGKGTEMKLVANMVSQSTWP
jgi:hypothetical protein